MCDIPSVKGQLIVGPVFDNSSWHHVKKRINHHSELRSYQLTAGLLGKRSM